LTDLPFELLGAEEKEKGEKREQEARAKKKEWACCLHGLPPREEKKRNLRARFCRFRERRKEGNS